LAAVSLALSINDPYPNTIVNECILRIFDFIVFHLLGLLKIKGVPDITDDIIINIDDDFVMHKNDADDSIEVELPTTGSEIFNFDFMSNYKKLIEA